MFCLLFLHGLHRKKSRFPPGFDCLCLFFLAREFHALLWFYPFPNLRKLIFPLAFPSQQTDTASHSTVEARNPKILVSCLALTPSPQSQQVLLDLHPKLIPNAPYPCIPVSVTTLGQDHFFFRQSVQKSPNPHLRSTLAP